MNGNRRSSWARLSSAIGKWPRKMPDPFFRREVMRTSWEDGHPRNGAVERLKAGEIKEWKEETDYQVRSFSETELYLDKQLFSAKLSLSDDNGQVG